MGSGPDGNAICHWDLATQTLLKRVAAYGGELETGPRSEGGYAVRVRLPLEMSG